MENNEILYPYSHNYYFGFFKGGKLLKNIYKLQNYNPNYTKEQLSLELYLLCKKKGYKPSIKSATYMIQNYLRKYNGIDNISTVNYEDVCYNSIDKTTLYLDDKSIEKVDKINLCKKITRYIHKNFNKNEQIIFNKYFVENLTYRQIAKTTKFKLWYIRDTIIKQKSILNTKFKKEYIKL